MSSAGFALQKAIHEALIGAGTVTALLGGARVYDDAPRGIAPPYITYAASIERDWSTGSEEGLEHLVTLHVWSKASGRKETHAILAAVRETLDDAALTLADHRLVGLRHEFSEARRDADGETYRGILRLRAVTEPAA